ncbi:MAG: tetratricopeptide repeat protein [Bacteroidia bacterium]
MFLIKLFIFLAIQLVAGRGSSISDKKNIDSLLNVINTSKDDTLTVKSLNKLTRKFIDIGEYDKALEYSAQSQKIAQKANFTKGLISSYVNTSTILATRGDYSQAMNYAINALKLSEKTNNKFGIGGAYNAIGTIYLSQNKDSLAINAYQKSLAVRESVNDVTGVAACYNNIGIIYRRQNNFEKALSAYMRCLYTLEEDAKKGQEKYSHGISSSYNNIGTIYQDLNRYEDAINYYKKAIAIRLEVNDLKGLASTYNNFGSVYLLKGSYDSSLFYLNKALPLNVKIGAKIGIYEAYSHFADLYYRKKDFKKALEYQKLHFHIKDSILNESLGKQVAEMNFKYDSEKKDRELFEKDGAIKAQEAEAFTKELERNTFIVGFILLLIVALVVFVGYRNNKAINVELNHKNELVGNQKQLFEEQNKKITSSINYAKRIQKSILPKPSDIKSVFSESFVFFRPKDIVSGDFYWIANIDNVDVQNKKSNLGLSKNVLIAAADSTGHGVPGALMGLMGINMLEQIVNEHAVYIPAAILNELDNKIINSLKSTNNSELLNEGIDIALCKIDLVNYKLEYAGAHNPLYIVRDNVLIEIKADRKTVGVARKKNTYKNNEFVLQAGDVLFLFSDGFADQKGGTENKKYFYKPFQELLLSIQKLTMEEQLKEIERVFDLWKGDNEQIDDILVMGIKIV